MPAAPIRANARRITFEYVMLKGVNDSDADAKELVRLLQGIPAGPFPFNAWEGNGRVPSNTRMRCRGTLSESGHAHLRPRAISSGLWTAQISQSAPEYKPPNPI